MPNTVSPLPLTELGAVAVLADLSAGWAPLSATKIRALPVLLVDGRRRDVSSIHRAFSRGVRGRNGQRVRLEFCIGPGGTRISTEPAVMRWLGKLNGQAGTSPIEINKAHAKADRRLKALGL